MKLRFVHYLIATIAVTVFLFWFSYFPLISTPISDVIPGVEKGGGEHLIAYTVYGFLLQQTLFRMSKKTLHIFILAAVIGVLVGGLTEYMQLFIAYRVCSLLDFTVNVFGVLFGSFIGLFFRKK